MLRLQDYIDNKQVYLHNLLFSILYLYIYIYIQYVLIYLHYISIYSID